MPDMQKMSRMPENGQEQQKQPPIAEFEGYTECLLFSEMCRITIDKEGMAIAGRFHQLPILYGEIQSLEASEFQLRLETSGGQVVFSRMGQELEWLADKLRNAYNDAVVSALLITGKPILAARESRFARYHANQGLVLLIACIAYSIVYGIVSSIILAISWRLYFITSIIGIAGIVFPVKNAV